MNEETVRDGNVVLLQFFWGHSIGTRGRVRRGKLLLKGSPEAAVNKRDIGELFRYDDEDQNQNRPEENSNRN